MRSDSSWILKPFIEVKKIKKGKQNAKTQKCPETIDLIHQQGFFGTRVVE
jgi:hypothetical protein